MDNMPPGFGKGNDMGTRVHEEDPVFCSCGAEMNELEQEWGVCVNCK